MAQFQIWMNRSDPQRSSCNAVEDKPAIVRSFFDDPTNYLDRRRFDIAIRKETVGDFLKDVNFEHVLDIGCGDGSISIPLLNERTRLTLVDVSVNMIDAARSHISDHLLKNARLLNQSLNEATLEPHSYDLIICIGVLAHVDSPRDLIDKASSLLKPGGMIISECTDSYHWVGRAQRLYRQVLSLFRPAPYSLNRLSALQVMEMFRDSGLRVKSVFRYSVPPPGTHRVLSQKDMYKAVRLVFGSAGRNRNARVGNQYLFVAHDIGVRDN